MSRVFQRRRERLCRSTTLHITRRSPQLWKDHVYRSRRFVNTEPGEQWLALEGPLLIIHEPEDIHYGGDLEKPFSIELWVELEKAYRYGYKYSTALNYVEQWVGAGGEILAKMAKRGERGVLTYPSRLSCAWRLLQ